MLHHTEEEADGNKIQEHDWRCLVAPLAEVGRGSNDETVGRAPGEVAVVRWHSSHVELAPE